MKDIFPVIQILISALLVFVILLQAKGTGLSATFGGEGGFYRSRRGVEKVLLYFTILLTFLFLVTALLGLVI